MSVVIGEFELVETPAQEPQSAPESDAGGQNQASLTLTDLAALQQAMIERALRRYAD